MCDRLIDKWIDMGERLSNAIKTLKYMIEQETSDDQNRKRLEAKLDGMKVARSYYDQIDRDIMREHLE